MWRGVRVTTAPAGDVLDLADVKARLRVDGADEDADIRAMVAQAAAMIEGPDGLGVALLAQTWTRSWDRFEPALLLPGWPVTGVTEVRYVDGAGATQVMDTADYRYDLTQEPAVVTPKINGGWPSPARVPGAVQVDYTLGVATNTEIAEPLRLLVMLLAGQFFQSREASVAGGPVSEVPLAARHIMDSYRRGYVA